MTETHREKNFISTEGSAKSVAALFLNGLKRKSDEKQIRAARELYRFIHDELKDESPHYINEFFSVFDSSSKEKEKNEVQECMRENSDLDEKKAGIFLIVCLLESSPIGEANRVNRYANLLLRTLTQPSVDEPTMELAARGISYLIQTSKVAELVDKCMDQCLEYLEQTERQEKRRLAAALLTRELALFTSTAFFVRASNYFRNIFKVIQDPKPNLRVAGVNSLHAALSITSQRETKHKSEWYNECFEEAMACKDTTKVGNLSRDDRYHSMLLVLNELVKISDASYERDRMSVLGHRATQFTGGSRHPVDWLIEPRTLHIVESRTARMLVEAHLDEIVRSAIEARSLKSQHVQTILLEIFPRLCAWPTYHDKIQRDKEMFDYTIAQMKINPQQAVPSVGMFMVLRPDQFTSSISQVMMILTESINQSIAKKKQIDPSIFTFLKLFVRAYGSKVGPHVRQILPSIMQAGLNSGLCLVLKDMLDGIPEMKKVIQDGLLDQLSRILTGQSYGFVQQRPLTLSGPIEVQNSELICLALENLGKFNFPRGDLQLFIKYIAEGYLVCSQPDVRIAAVKCTVAMIQPFVKIFPLCHRDHRDQLQELIHGVLTKIVSVGVVDQSVDVRLCVLDSLVNASVPLLAFLATPQMLSMLFMCLHDEKPEMQVAAIKLLGSVRMTEINPAVILPRLRRTLLEALSQLTTSGNARLEQHSARLIGQLARQNPDFIKVYVSPTAQAMLSKLRIESIHTDVTVEVLDCLGELAVVGGAEMVRSLETIFKFLHQCITDSSHRRRRHSALRAACRLIRSTAYVMEPYRDYPTLLDDLFRLLKTEMSADMRRQTIQVLGVLGALDPYTRKIFLGEVQSAGSLSTALSMPSSRDHSDTRQEIIQWFNYEKCTLEEFYPSITLANLMLMVQDDAYNDYSDLYQKIIAVLITIFRLLHQDEYKIYVEQVVPRLIEVTRRSRSVEQRKFFISHIADLINIVRLHAKNYIKPIFQIIADAWCEDHSMKLIIIKALEVMGTALGHEFSPFIPELIPYLLKVVQSDRTTERELTDKVLSCVRALSGCLTPHLHLILPPILGIVDDNSVQISVRERALATILHLAATEDISEFAPRLMQAWLRVIEVVSLQKPLLGLLVVVARQMWRHFDVYRTSVEAALNRHGLHCPEYDQLTKTMITYELNHASSGNGAPNPLPPTQMVPRPKIRAPVQPVTKQKLAPDTIKEAWKVQTLVNRDDWTQWLSKLRSACLRHSSNGALRAAVGLTEEHPHLAKDLFSAAFMSIWTELNEAYQNELTLSLETALQNSGHPDIVQSILNLAEFMDHSEKGPLPISYEVLGRAAQETRAYAKALRYKEIEIERKMARGIKMTAEDCQALITFANKLNVQDEAAGVVLYAEKHGMQALMQGKWYEKLQEWEKALTHYQTESDRQSFVQHEMRCLEALGRWKELNEKTSFERAENNSRIAVMSARGAWAENQWDRMSKFVDMVHANTQDGAFLRAVLAVKNQEYRNASRLIEKVRDMYDSELTAMAGESYERAYGAMVLVQQLAELEEAIEYKVRKDRRLRIALLWSRRLLACREDVEQWQRFLMLREMVMPPNHILPLKVKFASLCRRQGRNEMAREVLRNLLGLSSHAELHSASAPQDKPNLVMALCKQLWTDDTHGAALNTLEALSRTLDRNISQTPPNVEVSTQKRRMAAKVFVKMGEWGQIHGMQCIENQASMENAGGPLAQLLHQAEQSPRLNSETNLSRHVIKCYTKATEIDKNWHKAWHRLATTYYACLQRERERLSAMPSLHAQQLMPLAPIGVPQMGGGLIPGAMMPTNLPGALAPNLPFSTAPPMAPLTPNMQFSTMPPIQLSPAPLNIPPPITFQTSQPSPIEQQAHFYSIQAVKCFVEALKLAKGSRLEDTLRLLALLFDLGDSLPAEQRNGLKKLPPEMWLEVVPQLIARLDSPIASLVKQVILDVSKVYPQALVYALTVASKSQNPERSKNARELFMLFSDMSPKHKQLADEAKLVTDELVRCAILWHEQWNEALDEASRLYFQDKNIEGFIRVLEPLHKMIKVGATTVKENSFNQTYYADLADALKFCDAYKMSNNPKELSQAWEIYYNVFKRIQGQLRQLSTLDLTYVSPRLKNAKDLSISVPGTYDPSQSEDEIVRIGYVETQLNVISSKQRPRKMQMRGSNGKDYMFLLKGHEDPRQDERVMQLFGLVNTLLANNAETGRANLGIQRYSIVALSQNSGLIGWVPNCDTLHTLVKEYRDKKKISLSAEHKEMQTQATDPDALPLHEKVKLFELALARTPGDDLQKILWLKSPSSEVWFDRRTNYTRSMAVMSMVGYILGLGDRHPSNLMLDRLTGKIVHIDFGDCFEVAMSREKFPEKIPFRLTRMLVKAMEVCGIEGNYKHTCERVLTLLRNNKDSLLAVLEAFVYDPLINWRLLDVNKQRDPGEKQDLSKMKTDEGLSQESARKIVDRIKSKLAGRDFDPSMECLVKEQLRRLVDQATLAENLCQCYVGWCPFW